MQKGLIVGAIGLALSGALIGSVALAQGDPIAARKDNRKQAGAQMKAIKGIIDAKGPASGVVQAAAKLKELQLAFPALFPAGSDKGETKALPVVWSDKAGFAAANKAQDTALDALTAAAGSGDMAKIGEAFGNAAKTCGACHDKFRAK
ncbi:c-type cytochrome [Vineibacter terrae]|uniref:c-type cytochrome n=1 Tax=Vineibacter terrae TaxID=2586908 RepID=UPI001E5E19BB|nr:cytochrome c [Vineibacter terrae]